MTYEQSLDLAEIEADIAYEKFVEANEQEEHPEVIDTLTTNALLAADRYRSLSKQQLAL